MGTTPRPRLPIALPGGHFMGLAPLDVWARLLWVCRFRVRPRYWPRLAAAVATSVLATAITLPERVLLWPWLAWRFRGREARFVPRRDVVVVLGYFRSGTTHLHNLLATHPDVVTPRWVQAMSPQGFWLSWAFLGWALVPFLPNTRPQDGVAFGPDWPAEDDFAHNNWALASSLPGRLVLVRERERWGRFDSLEGLTSGELGRWRRAAAAFAWKVSAGRGGRTLALKSPSHTGRVRELDRLFGGRVRFVHIMRRAEDVVRSNVAMHRRLVGQVLQALPGDEALHERIVAEYVEAERRFLRDARELGLGPDRLVRMRYEGLVGEPMAELERVCRSLGLRWDETVRARAERYILAVGEYRATRHKGVSADPRLEAIERELAAGVPELGSVRESRGGNGAGVRVAPRRMLGVIGGVIGAAAGLSVWFLAAHYTENRLDSLAWPVGAIAGSLAVRLAGRGDWRLGVWAAVATMVAYAASVWFLPEVASGWTGQDRLRNIRTEFGGLHGAYLWMLFGLLASYRFASRAFVRPPGMG
ncbi:MAG: sulfotransferase [Phycisphaeraceae bacterium]|nr:sulfotransferase [Phycisphaeraceae bacterium]